MKPTGAMSIPSARGLVMMKGKRCAETLFMNYHDQNKVRIKIARIFNTYGPKMNSHDGRVVSNFIVQALKGERYYYLWRRVPYRSFQYVDDLVDGLIRLMDTPDSFTGPVNLGNPVEITISSLARMIIDMTGSKSKIVYLPLPQDDPKQRMPDISLARKEWDGPRRSMLKRDWRRRWSISEPY